MDNTISIYNKIFNIISELTTVNENGYNSYHKYKYIKQEDIINAIKPLLIKNRLLITNEVIEEETVEVSVGASKSMFSKVTLEFTITDLDSMAQIKQRYKGHGMDVGDKGIYKAMTGAEKYFYMKNFLIGAGNDDPEYNGIEQIPNNMNNGNTKGGTYNNKNNKPYNQSSNNTNNSRPNNNSNNVKPNFNNNTGTTNNINQNNNNVSQNDIKENSRPINPIDVKLPIKNTEQSKPVQLPVEFMNNNPVEDTEPRIDIRLQKLLFEACNQNKDIVLNAIQKLGYKSTTQIKVTEFKKVLELIKQQVKLLK